VKMDWEAQPEALAQSLHKTIDCVRCNWPTTLTGKHKRGGCCSRCSLRKARISSPRIGCVAGLPFLTRRTCSVASCQLICATPTRKAHWPASRGGRRPGSACYPCGRGDCASPHRSAFQFQPELSVHACGRLH
jgi:hypothetical protein